MIIKELEQRVRTHLEERGWDQLRPSDVAKSIMIEGAGSGADETYWKIKKEYRKRGDN